MKKIVYIITVVFFICCNNKSDETIIKVNDPLKKSLDQTFSDLKSKKYDTLVRNELKALALKFAYINKDYCEIYKYIDKHSNAINDQFGIIEAETNLGNYYSSKFQNDSAFYYFSKAEKISKNQKENPFMGSILQSKADLFWSQKNFSEAESTAIKALKIAVKKKNDEVIYSCYVTLGNSLNGLNNYDKAIQYYQKAIDAAENLKHNANYTTYKIQSINYISIVYQKQKKYNDAIKFARKGLNLIVNKSNEILVYTYLTNNLAYSKFKLGDISSFKQFLETLKIGDSLKSAPIQITSKTHLGEYYLAQKDTLKANLYLKAAQIQAHQNDIFEDELAILQLLAKANPNDKSFYSNRYISLNDSLQNVERATRDKFARIEFETEEITTEKNNLTVEKKGLTDQRWIIIGFSVFSILIIVLWFKNKSQKAKTRELLLKQEQQKANEEIYQLMLDQQQKIQEGKNIEKQRISLELHDGVMGKLSAVRLNLYASLYKANLIEEEIFSKQIDEIQAVEQEIRTIAHDLNSSLFSDNSNFIAIVKELFAKIENHSQIHFTLNVSDAVNWDLINNTIKINLYRILQEALQNIEKYADAKKVTVVMTKTETDEITVSISDDGNGFNTNQKKDGIGIKNMKTRMEELNGTFAMESELNKGTKINLIIPF